jgi:hypothetical protein
MAVLAGSRFMTTGTRRASGTKNATDLLLSLTFLRRRTPQQDAADLANGQTFEMASMSKTLGGEAPISLGGGKKVLRLKSGRLVVARNRPLVWRDRQSGSEMVLNGPFTFTALDKKVAMSNKMAYFELTSAEGTHELILPKVDAPLVELAIAAVPNAAA